MARCTNPTHLHEAETSANECDKRSLAVLQRRLDAVLDLHDSEWCEICKTALGCATRRAAEGEE